LEGVAMPILQRMSGGAGGMPAGMPGGGMPDMGGGGGDPDMGYDDAGEGPTIEEID
jgi:heat shock protein 1/8